EEAAPATGGEADDRKRRRRGRRGGRRRRRGHGDGDGNGSGEPSHGEAGDSETAEGELAAESGAPRDATEDESAGVAGETASEVAFGEIVAEAYEPPATVSPAEPADERIERAEPELIAAPPADSARQVKIFSVDGDAFARINLRRLRTAPRFLKKSTGVCDDRDRLRAGTPRGGRPSGACAAAGGLRPQQQQRQIGGGRLGRRRCAERAAARARLRQCGVESRQSRPLLQSLPQQSPALSRGTAG